METARRRRRLRPRDPYDTSGIVQRWYVRQWDTVGGES
jgi:hypothetical protein